MLVTAIDPGTEESALVVYDSLAKTIFTFRTWPNSDLVNWLATHSGPLDPLVVEMVESFGMPVGAETFATVWWSGRFHQAWRGPAHQLSRRAVKLHLCHSARATDANVRQALIDRFGPGKEAAIGLKSKQGPLYGLKSHEFAALGVALTWAETAGVVAEGPEKAQEPRQAAPRRDKANSGLS